MKMCTNLLKTLACICFAVPALSFAAEQEREICEPGAPTEVAEAEEIEQHFVRNGFIFDRYPEVYLPSTAHLVNRVAITGDEIELEDGSIWKISPYDGSKAAQWNSNTPVVVLQNTSWFSSYYFRIVNKSTGASIVANLFQGPYKDLSKRIVEIDYSRGLILLSDASHWEIHPSDRANFTQWNLNEPVFIGQNADYDSGWNSYWEGFLINTHRWEKFVRAHQY